MNWIRKFFGGAKQTPSELREVAGALVARTHDGKVVYNMLTPHMQQFMGRCVGAIKSVGVAAKGTGQFSVLVGEQQIELRLEKFYSPSSDPTLIDQVVAEAPTHGLITAIVPFKN